MTSRLSPLDTAFLHVEDRNNRMQLAGILTFVGPTPSLQEVRAEIEGKLPRLPHFRQRLATSAWGLGRPRWVDDESFDVAYHVRRAALPEPGGHAQLAALIDDMAAAPLDLARPLWELTLVEGIGDGFGLALKVHHCMVDGLSIIDIFSTLCAPANSIARPTLAAVPAAATPSAAFESLRRVRRAGRVLNCAPATRLNTGPSGPTRRTEYLTVPLRDIHTVRRQHDTTVNNVVLAVVTGALRRYFERHGDEVTKVHAFVPVNKRPHTARGAHGNQIGMTYPALPVGEDDSARRIELVKAAVAACHETKQADDFAALIQLGRFAPAPLAAAVNRAMQFRANTFNLTVTNVPGPPMPVYFLGRELLSILGATPLTRKHALTIAVVSYNGELTFSVTTDPRRLPDGSDLVTDISAELDALIALAPIGANHA